MTFFKLNLELQILVVLLKNIRVQQNGCPWNTKETLPVNSRIIALDD